MKPKTEIKRLGITGSLAIYIPAAILLYCITNYLIPFLSAETGQETILFWFIAGGLGVFLPLMITGFVLLKYEGFQLSWRLNPCQQDVIGCFWYGSLIGS